MVEKTIEEKFEEEFRQEIKEITDINKLKEYYAKTVAKKDKLIQNLQEQNRILLKTALKTAENRINAPVPKKDHQQ